MGRDSLYQTERVNLFVIFSYKKSRKILQYKKGLHVLLSPSGIVRSQNNIFGFVWNMTSPISQDVTSKDVVFPTVGVLSPELPDVE